MASRLIHRNRNLRPLARCHGVYWTAFPVGSVSFETGARTNRFVFRNSPLVGEAIVGTDIRNSGKDGDITDGMR
jgi:hypothetical protein